MTPAAWTHFIRRTVGRVPLTVWKLLAQYLIGFGLLAVIIYWNWSARPGKPNDNQKAVAFLAGAGADAQAQQDRADPEHAGPTGHTHDDAVIAIAAKRPGDAQHARRARLPSVFGWKPFCEAGGLASYGPNMAVGFGRLAYFVERIAE